MQLASEKSKYLVIYRQKETIKICVLDASNTNPSVITFPAAEIKCDNNDIGRKSNEREILAALIADAPQAMGNSTLSDETSDDAT